MRVICVDARNMCYKAAWVGRGLRASGGQETGAVHGVLLGMLALKRRYPDAKFVCVWDGLDTLNSWRSTLFADYKSRRRNELPEDVKELRASVMRQIDHIKALLDSVGVAQIEVARLEADDVIGILTEKVLARGWPVMVYSSDQDYLQLMAYGVEIVTSASAVPVTENVVLSKWRCGSKDILKLRALLGDVSDCIPRAVSGVGPVAAAKYIEAGIDPEVPTFAQLPRSVRLGAERLEHCWPTIHRNWRLMRILRSCHDPDFPKELVGEVAVETRRVLRQLSEPTKRSQVVYGNMLSLMSKLDLSVAVENRAAIWRLQAVSTVEVMQ